MISFPNCKINLGLNIVGKRTDGYHDLETVFYPLQLKDALEVIQQNDFSYTSSGLAIAGNTSDNLCVKAYNILKRDFPQLPAVHIHLHKAIPMGAGLGGGSADGAFMLHLLNEKFNLNLSEEQLINYALELGSDCPFFIINKPCFATGRGEKLEQIQLVLSSYQFVLINPAIHVSTKEAFNNLLPCKPRKSIKEIITQPLETWRQELHNDFENSIFELHPSLKDVKNSLYTSGAIYASMTGTGSTVYGIFPPECDLKLSFPENYAQVTLPSTAKTSQKKCS